MHQKGQLSRAQELDYISTWFNEFSEMQRGDFFKVLQSKYGPNSTDDEQAIGCGLEQLKINGSSDGQMNGGNAYHASGGRPPSIFQCRVKLFNEWFLNWSDEEKQELLNRLRNIDSKYMDDLEAAIAVDRADQDSGVGDEKICAVNGTSTADSGSPTGTAADSTLSSVSSATSGLTAGSGSGDDTNSVGDDPDVVSEGPATNASDDSVTSAHL